MPIIKKRIMQKICHKMIKKLSNNYTNVGNRIVKKSNNNKYARIEISNKYAST